MLQQIQKQPKKNKNRKQKKNLALIFNQVIFASDFISFWVFVYNFILNVLKKKKKKNKTHRDKL